MSLLNLSWQEQSIPLINNRGDTDYWDNYIDEDPWTDNIKDMIDLEMIAKVILDRYLDEQSISLKEEGRIKQNFYLKVFPLAISYLQTKGEINVGVLEAMIMQNI